MDTSERTFRLVYHSNLLSFIQSILVLKLKKTLIDHFPCNIALILTKNWADFDPNCERGLPSTPLSGLLTSELYYENCFVCAFPAQIFLTFSPSFGGFMNIYPTYFFAVCFLSVTQYSSFFPPLNCVRFLLLTT